MSSTLSLHGSLQFPPGALERWQAATLPVSEPDEGRGDIFAYGNDLGSVCEVLEDVADCHVFVRFIVEGDTLQVRAVLGDDYWCVWCGRIFALTQAAAQLGARGEIDTEDDSCYSGTLVVVGPKAVYVPAGPRRRAGKQEVARADTWRIGRR